MSLRSFSEFFKCSRVKSIQEINDDYDYEDEHPQGKGDTPEVACGQDGSYNELQYIYDKKLAEHIESEAFTEQEALEALCEACRELPNPRDREDFYKYLSDKLGVEISI